MEGVFREYWKLRRDGSFYSSFLLINTFPAIRAPPALVAVCAERCILRLDIICAYPSYLLTGKMVIANFHTFFDSQDTAGEGFFFWVYVIDIITHLKHRFLLTTREIFYDILTRRNRIGLIIILQTGMIITFSVSSPMREERVFWRTLPFGFHFVPE